MLFRSAAYFGAHVIATGSAHNESWLRELGAAEVVDHNTTRFEDVVSRVDVVIDLVGNVHDHTGTRSLPVLRPGGLLVNAPSGSWPTLMEDAAAAGVRATTYKTSPDGSTLAIIGRLLDSGDVHVTVDQVFDLGRVAEAHTAIRGTVRRGDGRGAGIRIATATSRRPQRRPGRVTAAHQLLGGYARAEQAPAIVMVTHHVEEIPLGFGHALLLSRGRIAAAGPIGEVITSEKLTEAFGLELEVEERDGRFTARAAQSS